VPHDHRGHFDWTIVLRIRQDLLVMFLLPSRSGSGTQIARYSDELRLNSSFPDAVADK
jgi:hypothetical protein